MSYGRNVIYLYDGSFEGLLSAVFDSYANHEIPSAIEVSENGQQTLFYDYLHIPTDFEKSDRVLKKITAVAGQRAAYEMYRSFFANFPDKGIIIFYYIRACLKFGYSVTKRLTEDCVNAVMTASQKVGSEAHLYTGFVRFSELSNGVYYSRIEPKNNILPIIAYHFVRRYGSMAFMIHDTSRGMCLVYNGKECNIYPADTLPALTLSGSEKDYRKLWKEFYDTIAIKERINKKCQMTHLPKHFRRFMTEFDISQAFSQ